MATEAGKIFFTIGADTDEIEKKPKSAFEKLRADAKKTAKSVGKAFAAIGVAAAAVGAASLFIAKKFVDVASDAEELRNVTDTAFGDMADGVREWAKEQGDAMQRSSFQMTKFASEAQAMLSPMLGSADAAAEMSKGVAKLSVDLGSFFNVADEDAMLALKSAMVGQSEPMRKFGVVLTEASLGQFALQQGMTKSIKKMTEAEKVQLRYNFILEQTKLAQGDAAKTAGSYANVVKGIEGEFTNVSETIGSLLMPIANVFAKSALDSMKNLRKWVEANKAAIIDWIVKGWSKLAQGIIVVVTAVSWLAKGFNAVKVAVGVVVGGIAEMWRMLFSGIEKALGVMAKLADMAGLDSVAAQYESNRKALEGWAEGAEAVRDASFGMANDGVESFAKIDAGVDATITKLADLDYGVRRAARSMKDDLAKSAEEGGKKTVAAVKKASKDIVDTNVDTLQNKLPKLWEKLNETIRKNQEELRTSNGEIAEAITNDAVAVQEKQVEMYMQIGSAAAAAFGEIGRAWAEGNATAMENAANFLTTIIDMAERVIMAMAAEAAAAQFAAGSIFGGLGLLAAAAAASAAFGLAKGYIGKLPEAAQGGIVTGGVPGKDSVPIMAMPGEMILPVETTRALMSASRRGAGRAAAQGGVVQAAGAGGPNVTFQVQLLESTTEEQLDKMLMRMGRRVGVLMKRGHWPT